MAKHKVHTNKVLLFGSRAMLLGSLEKEANNLPVEFIECSKNEKFNALLAETEPILILADATLLNTEVIAILEKYTLNSFGHIYLIVLAKDNTNRTDLLFILKNSFAEVLYEPVSSETLKNKIINHIDLYEKKNELTLTLQELEIGKKRLAADEQKIKILTNAVSEPIIFVDQNLIINFWNKEAESFFGYTKFEVVNESFLRWIVAPKSHAAVKELFSAVQKSGAGILKREQSFIFRNKLGIELNVDLTISHHKIDVDKFNLVFVIHDTSTDRKLEKETHKARELREENKLMRELFNYVNHELRTPLNAIVGISKTLLSYSAANLNERQQEGISLIQRSGEELIGLIKDLLGISQMEANKLSLMVEFFDFDKLLSQQKTQTLNLIGKKNIKFILKRSPAIPKTIKGDQIKINQILTNIVGNAVKYTNEGKIILSSHLIDNKLYFEVSDTGVGIPKDMLSTIFDKFARVKSHTKLAPGSGLGLHITKKLIILMNGEIKAESVPGKGTILRFFITLPADVRPVKPVPVQTEIEAADLRIFNYSPNRKLILVIDDSIQNSFIYSIISEQANYSVMLCDNSKRALLIAKEFTPDLIILKFEMPALHGSSIIKELQRREINVPVIAFSEYEKYTTDLPQNTILLEEPISLEALFPILQNQIQWQPKIHFKGAIIVEESTWIRQEKNLGDGFIEIYNIEEELSFIKICQQQFDYLIFENIDQNSNGLGLFLRLINENRIESFEKIILHHESAPMKYLVDKLANFSNVVVMTKKEILKEEF
jgi:PAS domain S-box-containing protein